MKHIPSLMGPFINQTSSAPQCTGLARRFGLAGRRALIQWMFHGERFAGLTRVSAILGLILASIAGLHAQTAPFSPSDWPPTISATAAVDYCILDPNATFNSPAAWNN